MGMDLALKAKLQKQRYHIVGEHGGVKSVPLDQRISIERQTMLQRQVLRYCEPQLHANLTSCRPT